jgi:hypothetical protein
MGLRLHMPQRHKNAFGILADRLGHLLGRLANITIRR